jgi:hypothetical protein
VKAHIQLFEIEEAEECMKKYLKICSDTYRGYLNMLEI